MSDLRVGNPTRWGLDKLSLLKSWCTGGKHPEIWVAINKMSPQVFPGAPPEVIMGFCANGGGLTENTTDNDPKQTFHECGIFGTECGLRGGPAPNQNPFATYNSWGLVHNNATVRLLLGGRDATMVPDAWKTAVDDQVAVGLVNILREGKSLATKIDHRLIPQDPGSF